MRKGVTTPASGSAFAAALSRVFSVGLFVALLTGAPLVAAHIAPGAGCSSESAVVDPPPLADVATEGDATTDAGLEAGPVVGCPGETPADYPWSPVVPKEDACTDADLAKLAAAIKGRKGATVAEIRVALGPSCASCAIGKVGDPSWRAIVDGHLGYIGNVGGCVVQLGATDACGRATDRLSTCLIVGCRGCAEGADQDTCADALTVVNGPCAAELQTLRKECRTGSIGDAFSSNGPCQSFVETIRLFCGPASPSDAGPG